MFADVKEALGYIEDEKILAVDLQFSDLFGATGKELVKVKTKIKIAIDRATFGDITPDVLRPGVITEAADMQVSMLALALRGGGKGPIANDVFFIRLTDQGSRTDIDIAKEGHGEGPDALDMKNVLLCAQK